MDHFELVSEYAPTGDQPQAIADLVKGFKEGNQCETLLGVTGSGKTFTMANVIQQLNKPTLIIAHNKTLAAQLYGEFKEFFPNNAVEYFVSYYDYYQPGHLHRQGLFHQRRDRQAPSLRHHGADGAPRRHHCCQCVLHLRSGEPGRLSEYGDLPAPGHDQGPG